MHPKIWWHSPLILQVISYRKYAMLRSQFFCFHKEANLTVSNYYIMTLNNPFVCQICAYFVK